MLLRGRTIPVDDAATHTEYMSLRIDANERAIEDQAAVRGRFPSFRVGLLLRCIVAVIVVRLYD